MEYGGTKHTELNTSNYASGIFPDIATFEKAMHTQLNTLLVTQGALLAGLTNAGDTKLTALVAITNTAFNRTKGQGILVPALNGSTGYGTRSKIDTIFAVKMHYWAYVVSAVTAAGAAITYTVPAYWLKFRYHCY